MGPFMPEMLRYVGQAVHGVPTGREDLRHDRADRQPANDGHGLSRRPALRRLRSRRVPSRLSPLLEGGVAAARRGGIRDDGSADPDGRVHAARAGRPGRHEDHREFDGETTEVWRCQATEALAASTPLKVRDLGQYWREVKSRNYRLLRLVPLLVRAFVLEVASRTRIIGPRPAHGRRQGLRAEELDLQPGDVVKVRPPEEIARTLDGKGLNRGLSFDREMLPFCGRTCVVQERVHRIIDDRTGRMIKIRGDAVILEGIVCSGERSVGRWFCPARSRPTGASPGSFARIRLRRPPTSGALFSTRDERRRRHHRVDERGALARAMPVDAVRTPWRRAGRRRGRGQRVDGWHARARGA